MTEYYRCTRCSLTCQAGTTIDCANGPCHMALVPSASAAFDAKMELERAGKRFSLLARLVTYEDVIAEYARNGISGTPHDIEHKAAHASLCAELRRLS